MKKKIVSFIAILSILVLSFTQYSYADKEKKVIYINMNRTNIEDLLNIDTLNKELENRGYVGLMNVRGDQGTDDRRSYATIGAGGRANVSDQDNINFTEINDELKEIYKYRVGKDPKYINDIDINKSLTENEQNGEYGSTLGSLGQALSDNNIKSAIIGNADIVKDGELIKNRNIGLIAMDNYGRIPSGNIDNINKEDLSMPYGISTDYEKLLSDTKKYYDENDVLFIELGDTYRLDLYKSELNKETYESTKERVYDNIDKYLAELFSYISEDDVVYISSPFVSDSDYDLRKRLSTIVKFDGDERGILTSSTTRRDGVVANLDLGVDILSEMNVENDIMVGRKYDQINTDENISYLNDEYEKMVSISATRSNVVNTFVGVISASWVLGMFVLLFRNKIPYSDKALVILKEIIKLGIIMPLAFLLSPIFNFKTPTTIAGGILLTTFTLYIVGKKLFKDDIKHMGFFSLVTISLIAIDSMFGTYLMQNNIMSYDAIIGARYYGIGNEYEGVTIGSAIFAFAVLLHYKKIPRWLVVILSGVILITSAYPSMGANVGGAISESIAYLLFILLIFDMKIDLKKIIILGVFAVFVVGAFAILDMISGSQSHLSVFVNQILVNGPSVIIQTFTRKIEMNMKLAQTSVWVNILLAGIFIIATLIFRPTRHFDSIKNKYPYIFKAFVASMVGCIVTLLVNDSGIVAASTASIYILIPLIIISINMVINKK